MIYNYILSAIRNIKRHSFYSVINISGLAIGICCSIFIYLYIQDELSYDKHHEKHKRIYRLESNYILPEKEEFFAASPYLLAPTLKEECDEIEDFFRIFPIGETLLEINKEKILFPDIAIADSSIFNVFTHPLIEGSPKTALAKPFTMVVSESFAKKYYPNKSPIGQKILVSNKHSYEISAIMKDLPTSSHMRYQVLVSSLTRVKLFGDSVVNRKDPSMFWSVSVYSYILLKENENIESIQAKFPSFCEKYTDSLGKKLNAKFKIMVTPLSELHLKGGLQWDYPTGNISYVYIFGVIGFFLLLIACINYMNMATARSAMRLKEVGVRKVLGAYKKSLITQFIGESIILTLISLVLAIGLVEILLPIFNQIADKNVSISIITNPSIVITIVSIVLFVGLVSGSYPAFYLSSFQPASVLKGRMKDRNSKGILRKILVVIQFTISVVMIISTIIVSSQLDFLRNKDLGFNKNDIIYMSLSDSSIRNNPAKIKNELLSNPNVLKVAISDYYPSDEIRKILMRIENKNDSMIENTVNTMFVDHDFLDLIGAKIMIGRMFDKKSKDDLEKSFIINETAAEKFGWKSNPIGRKIEFGLKANNKVMRTGTVIGVIKDFHYSSLQKKIEPIIIALSEKYLNELFVKISKENIDETMSFIKSTWERMNPNYPFDYKFLDESFQSMYVSQQKLSQLFRFSTIICILISCLGLFGLSSFVTEQKIKEIGIRKVLGATFFDVFRILYKHFAILVAISIIIAIPISYFAMKMWLNNFAYRTELTWHAFVIGSITAIVITAFTITFHAIKAGLSNPVNALKYE